MFGMFGLQLEMLWYVFQCKSKDKKKNWMQKQESSSIDKITFASNVILHMSPKHI